MFTYYRLCDIDRVRASVVEGEALILAGAGGKRWGWGSRGRGAASGT